MPRCTIKFLFTTSHLQSFLNTLLKPVPHHPLQNQKKEIKQNENTIENLFLCLACACQVRGDIKQYRSRIRELLQNLRDPTNPDLKARVKAREILPRRLVAMSTEVTRACFYFFYLMFCFVFFFAIVFFCFGGAGDDALFLLC